MAGDTVILMDGVYTTQLNVANSGTSSAWITFQADTCATPIIQGPGVSPTDTNQDTGVGSATASYVRFIGIVSTGWSTGFGNGWTGTDTTTSERQLRVRRLHRRLQRPHRHHVLQRAGAQGQQLHRRAQRQQHHGVLVERRHALRGAGSAGASTIEGNVSFENDGRPEAHRRQRLHHRRVFGTARPSSTTSPSATAARRLRLTTSMNMQVHQQQLLPRRAGHGRHRPQQPQRGLLHEGHQQHDDHRDVLHEQRLRRHGTGPGATAIYNSRPPAGRTTRPPPKAMSYFTSPDGTNPDFTLASGSALIGKGRSG